MNQVKIDAMQKVLPVEKRVVGGKEVFCVSVNAMVKFYQLTVSPANFVKVFNSDALIEDVNSVTVGETVWMPIEYAIKIVEYRINKYGGGINGPVIMEYLQSFDETHEVAE